MDELENLTEFEQLESDMELLLWNDSFGTYSTEEFDTIYKDIIKKMEILDK
jgi:hypothetical protein